MSDKITELEAAMIDEHPLDVDKDMERLESMILSRMRAAERNVLQVMLFGRIYELRANSDLSGLALLQLTGPRAFVSVNRADKVSIYYTMLTAAKGRSKACVWAG